MNETPEHKQRPEIPHPLLLSWPRVFECRIYEKSFWREQIALAGGQVIAVRDILVAGKSQISIQWPASYRQPMRGESMSWIRQ
jgi:hypothetical protein